VFISSPRAGSGDHDRHFELSTSKISCADLYAAIAVEIGLDVAQLRAALQSSEFLENVRSDFNGGVRSGVNGTPTFFVNGARYEGAHGVEAMAEALDRAVLAKRKRK
jgi:predicted DsbA family dithiol-disulfide isomerase